MIRRCPRCRAEFDPPARFCTRCGVPLVETAEGGPSRVVTQKSPRLPDPDAPRLDALEAKRLSSLSGSVLDGKYLIGRKIGEGGMSWVYQAEEVGTGRTVAIKVLPPRLAKDHASVERLRREAEIAGKFNHPNVCPIFRFGQSGDGMLYVVMPYLQGETLNDYEGTVRQVPVNEAVSVLVQVARGLQHAHDLGIVHRDLKPENVMLVQEGSAAATRRAVVMDFGLAKERRTGQDVLKLTQTGIVLGTPEFMSPEQIRGRPLDGRSDVYALGVLAFELLTGELPFGGDSAQETMVARLKGLPRSMRDIRPDIPSRMESVIRKALALAPEDRWQTMDEFAQALEGGAIARFFRRS